MAEETTPKEPTAFEMTVSNATYALCIAEECGVVPDSKTLRPYVEVLREQLKQAGNPEPRRRFSLFSK